ncbi:transposase [Enterococcus sp. DIV1444a]
MNKKKVQRLIRKLGIEVRSYTRKSRRYSSYRGQLGTVIRNRLRRRFYTNICHQKITTDTTEFKYFELDTKGIIHQKKLYLDPFMDMYNSEILSYRISEKPNALACNGWVGRSAPDYNGLPLSSDLSFRSGVGLSNESLQK